jgi:hypothetical protein
VSHMYHIGNRLKIIIEDLLSDVSDESQYSGYDTVARDSMLPLVEFRKRRAGRGRGEEDLMRIDEGITIFPLDPVNAHGTNERDGVGYRYVISIAQGTVRDEVDINWGIPIWEQAIRQRFQNKRMGSLMLDSACELRTQVEPGKLPDWAYLPEGVDATFLVLTEYVRENRRG